MEEIRVKLQKLARGNGEYAVFNKKIINTKKEVMGVRTPDMRKLTKELTHDVTQDDILELFKQVNKDVYEEISIIGALIGYAEISDVEKIRLIKKYLELVDNWAHIDSFVTRKMNSDEWWEFAKNCLKSPKEFVVRFGVIVMMENFLDNKHIDDVLKEQLQIKHDGYYVKMGVAWLYATAAVKYYEKTLDSVVKLEPWTQRKALTKMIESYRFTPEQKTEIRELRAKI